MMAFRSFLFNVWFFASLTFVVLLMWLLLPFHPRVLHRSVRYWAQGIQWGMRWILGLTYEIRGRENLPDGGVVIACKHQSVWDTTIFHILFNEPVYVMKKELMSIPLWGWYAKKCRAVGVDRKAGASALKSMVRGVGRMLDAGFRVIIFPEGTRTAPGTHTAYHPGIAAVYTQTKATVVPAALNSGLFWGRHSFLKKPGHIVLEFLAPISPGLDRRTFMRLLESRIEEASARLAHEGDPARFPPEGDPARPADKAN